MTSKPSIRLPHSRSSRKGYCMTSENLWTRHASMRNVSLLRHSNIESIHLVVNGARNPSRWIWRSRHQNWYTWISRRKNNSMIRAASMIVSSQSFNRPKRQKDRSERSKSLQSSPKRWARWESTRNNRNHHHKPLHISLSSFKARFPYWKTFLPSWSRSEWGEACCVQIKQC